MIYTFFSSISRSLFVFLLSYLPYSFSHTHSHSANEDSFKRWCHEKLDSIFRLGNAPKTMHNLHQTNRVPEFEQTMMEYTICTGSRCSNVLFLATVSTLPLVRMFLPSHTYSSPHVFSICNCSVTLLYTVFTLQSFDSFAIYAHTHSGSWCVIFVIISLIVTMIM